MRSLLAVSVLACSLACQTVPSSTVEPIPNDEPSSKPNPTDVEQPADDPTEPERVDPPAPELPPCPAETGLTLYCTTDGKFAGGWGPADTLRMPDDVQILFNVEGPHGDRTSLMVAIRGDELFVKHVTCGACRRVMGHGFSGRLSAMTEDQVRQMQTQLGLAADVPLLTTTDQWADYAKVPAGIAALTEIAGRGR